MVSDSMVAGSAKEEASLRKVEKAACRVSEAVGRGLVERRGAVGGGG